jgi:hypothetical protein
MDSRKSYLTTRDGMVYEINGTTGKLITASDVNGNTLTFTAEGITSSASPRVLYIRGFPGAVIEGIRISNSTFNGVTETEVVQHAGTITLQNVTILPAKAVKSLNSVPATK